MTRLFRSKSCGVARTSASMFSSNSSSSPPNNSSLKYLPAHPKEEENDDDDEEEEEEEEGDDDDAGSPVTTPFIIISPESRSSGGGNRQQSQQLAILDILATALKKSLVTCSVERDDVASSMDISWPTDVRHVSHVTFDRFNGFLGLPLELQPQLPRKVPSASVSVFGVSANSMQCSYDQRGNSVPTILLMVQKRLYSAGGLQAEGIFRINAENSQEEDVRNHLNKGVVPRGIDVHCLAGLIKAWFRELPAGVLDSLTPEQVMHCNTEEECTQLVKLLPPTEAALLDWAINLMADVVKHENDNKMNARNIAMVFAPNMTQMADPLTALIHAVQVMNFLKTLIIKALRERDEELDVDARLFPSSRDLDSPKSSKSSRLLFHGQTLEGAAVGNLFRSVTLDRLETDSMERYWSFHSRDAAQERHESISSRRRMRRRRRRKRRSLEDELRGEYDDDEDDDGEGEEEGIFDRLSLKKGVRKLCRHPVFQLSKAVAVKKPGTGGLGIVNSNGGGGGREACA